MARGGRKMISAASSADGCDDPTRPTLLDDMLASVFGDSFAGVLEFESRSTLGTNLQCAMRRDPSRAYRLLRKVFILEEAVDLLLANVSRKVTQLGTTPEHQDLRVLIAKVIESKPLTHAAG